MIDVKRIRAEFAKVRNQRVKELVERDGCICHYCHYPLIPPGTPKSDEKYYEKNWVNSGEGFWYYYPTREYRELHVDHKHPVHLGGGNELSNLVLACVDCNSTKHVKYTYEAFMNHRALARLIPIEDRMSPFGKFLRRDDDDE